MTGIAGCTDGRLFAVLLMWLLISFGNLVSLVQAHPLDLAVITVQESALDAHHLTLAVQLNSNAYIPLSALVDPPEACHVLTTAVDVEDVSQYRYRQILNCIKPGFANKRLRFTNLPEDTNVMVRLLRGDQLILEQLLERGAREWQLEANALSIPSVLARYLLLGVEHILIGADHLLFLCMLLLLASWGRRLLLLITAFTFGHSVTLALATFEVVQLASAPVEATIALSILFLAAEIIRYQYSSVQTLTLQYPGVITAFFGCLHGLGFASVLQDIGVSKDQLIWNLVGFNLGVEVGQLLFVAVVLLLGLIAKKFYLDFFKSKTPFAYVGGSIGAYWFVERIASF